MERIRLRLFFQCFYLVISEKVRNFVVANEKRKF